MIHVSTPDSDTVRTAVQLDPDLAMAVLGAADTNLRTLEELLDADLHVRGGTMTVSGHPEAVDTASRVVSDLLRQARKGVEITPASVRRSVEILAGSGPLTAEEVLGTDVLSRRGGMIRPKTLGQKRYVDAIDEHTISFGLGPAGTGKTYLAMAKAVAALRAKEVSRIILTRPAVEAGERLGYLPGTLHEKIDPYLRPLFDSLHDMMDPETIPKLMAAGVIEVAPLAYMRGRTLNDSFIVLDEAQNTTPEQMKMFLTRLGFGSKIVVTGDITQIDLPGGQRSGLKVVREILSGVEGIHFSELTSKDVVRHALVGRIVDAYAKHEARLERSHGETRSHRNTEQHRNREQRRR
ncbi:PhoH family protein [Dietzia aurantiaca]|uniref:PhoH-like protein n=1 Tax=Dietzia aurantiaca TaxID=983873 RepID=A0ABV9PQE9_9ACTN